MPPYQLLTVAKKLGPDFLVDSLLGALIVIAKMLTSLCPLPNC